MASTVVQPTHCTGRLAPPVSGKAVGRRDVAEQCRRMKLRLSSVGPTDTVSPQPLGTLH
jgi:hypothetical protein